MFRLDYPVLDHNINISNCNPLADSSYTKLPKELDHSRKGLINIQNIDDNALNGVWSEKRTLQVFFFQLYFNRKHVEVAIIDFTIHLIILI